MLNNDFINMNGLEKAFQNFTGAYPFDHCVVDDFLLPKVLDGIEDEFLDFYSEKWFCYKNPIEDKKALNDWNAFPKTTYSLFEYLNSTTFVSILSKVVGMGLMSDSGLHGGGWHIHGTGGNLNPHLDYSIHPKLGMQRKLNIIIYVSRELKEEHGGHLGLWTHGERIKRPDKLAEEIVPKCNRAVIFDTTQNSWHGMSRPLTQPEGVYRKSLAIYYLCNPPEAVDPRGRALFAPRKNQEGDKAVEEIIRLRSNVGTSQKVYRS